MSQCVCWLAPLRSEQLMLKCGSPKSWLNCGQYRPRCKCLLIDSRNLLRKGTRLRFLCKQTAVQMWCRPAGLKTSAMFQ